MSSEGEAQVASITPKGKWPLLLAVPEEALPTEEARRVLPPQYSRADAVTNVQNSMLLLAAFVQGRRDLLASALEDRMHQPYRAALCPLLPALQKLAGRLPGRSGRSAERSGSLRADFSGWEELARIASRSRSEPTFRLADSKRNSSQPQSPNKERVRAKPGPDAAPSRDGAARCWRSGWRPPAGTNAFRN